MQEQVCILEEIGDYDGNKYVGIQHTDKLKEFIEKYGVNYMDILSEQLIDLIYLMNKEQLDLFMSYKPNVYYILDGKKYLTPIIPGKNCEYMLHKLIENDDKFKLLRAKLWYPLRYKEPVTYLEHLKCGDKPEKGSRRAGMIMLLENYEKRYYRLFDLLLKQCFNGGNNWRNCCLS